MKAWRILLGEKSKQKYKWEQKKKNYNEIKIFEKMCKKILEIIFLVCGFSVK